MESDVSFVVQKDDINTWRWLIEMLRTVILKKLFLKFLDSSEIIIIQ